MYEQWPHNRPKNIHVIPPIKRICLYCKEEREITTLCSDCGRWLFHCCNQEWGVSGICRSCMMETFDMEERRLSY